MTDATPANVVALRVFRNAFLIAVALFAQINVRQAKVPGRVRVLPNGAYTNAVTAVGIIPDAVIRESTVLPKVARLVATPFPLNVVRPLSTLTRIGPTFRIRTQHVLALVIVLAVVSNGRCKSDAFTRKVVGEYEVALEAGTNAESGRRIGMFAVCVRRTLRVDAANAGGASDESLTPCPRDNGTERNKEADQLQHNQ